MGELRPKDISKSCPDHSARSNQVNSQTLLVSKSQYFHCAIIFLIIPKNSKNKVLNLEKTLETHQSCCLDFDNCTPNTESSVRGAHATSFDNRKERWIHSDGDG